MKRSGIDTIKWKLHLVVVVIVAVVAGGGGDGDGGGYFSCDHLARTSLRVSRMVFYRTLKHFVSKEILRYDTLLHLISYI